MRVIFRAGVYGLFCCLLFGCAAASRPDIRPGKLVLEVEGVSAEETLSGRVLPASAERVEAHLDWPGFIAGGVLEWRWVAPGGEIYARERRLVRGPEDATRLDLSGVDATGMEGRWELSVWLEGEKVAGHSFQLAADLDHWKVLHADERRIRAGALQELCREGDFPFLVESYSFEMTAHEKSMVQRCLAGDLNSAVPVLEEALKSDPEREPTLALAYRIKKDLLYRVARDSNEIELLEWIKRLITPYDGHDLGELLESEREAVRLRGVELLEKVNSKPAVLELARALRDPSPAVREAAAGALRRSDFDLAREILADAPGGVE